MKNTIEIYLKADGTNAEVKKDFAMYVGSYQNKLVDVYVPKSILYSNHQSTFNNAIKIGGLLTADNGKTITTSSYYLNYLKDTTINNIEYSVYERILPKELTVYAGNIQIITNVLAVDYTAQSSDISLGIFENFTKLNEYVTKETITLTDNHVAFVATDTSNYVRYRYNTTSASWEIDTTSSVVLQLVTTQICNLLVQKSSYLDNDTTMEPTEYELLNSRVTTNTTNIIALQNDVSSINENISDLQEDVTDNTTDIAKLKQSILISETYITSTSGTSLPTTDELNAIVQEKVSRQPQKGDVIIFTLTIEGATDKNYKYIYSNLTGWNYYELPPMEEAYNGSLGLVKGTYDVGASYTTLVNIVGGEIKNIYVKNYSDDTYIDLYRFLNNNMVALADIVSGTQTVGKANKAIADQNGNVINTTYQTINAGASKQYVKDYALPKQFYSTYYIASDGYQEKPPTTPESGVQFSQKISGVTTGTTMFDLSRTLVADVVLNDTNSSKNSIYVSSDVDKSIQLRLTTRAKKADATAWTTLSVEVSNILTLTAGEIQRVDFESSFTSLTQVLELAENDYYGQVLEVITTDSTEFTLSIYGNSTYASSFTINTSTQQIVVQSGKLGEIPSYTLTGTKTDTTISFDLSSETKLYNNVETQFILSYDGEIADTDSLKITYGSQDIRIVTPYNLESGNATYKQLNQTRIADNTITFIGLIQIDSGSNISVVVEEDNLTATKNELNVSAKEEIVLGADASSSVLVGEVNFIVQDSETYLPYKVNGTKFLLDLSYPFTSEVYPFEDVVSITFHGTKYYLFGAYGGSHLTLGDLQQIAKYNTTTGYRYIFEVMYFENSTMTGFAIIPTLGATRKIDLVYDGTNITREGIVQTFNDLWNLTQNKNNIVDVYADIYNLVMRYDAYEDDAIWFNSRYKINGVNYLNRLIINSSNEIIFDDDAVLTQYATMPTASDSLSGVIAQYIGATNTNYTNGYFYKCSETVQDIAESLIATQTAGYNLGTISVDKNEYLSGIVAKGYDHGITEEDKIEFEFRGYPEVIKCSVGEDEFVLSRASDEDVDNEVKAYAWKYDETIFYTKTKFPDGNTYFYGTSDWTNRTELNFESVTSYNETTDGYWTCNNDWYDVENELEYNIVDLADFGITFTGTATVGSKFTTQYTAPQTASNVYLWSRIDVQPTTDLTDYATKDEIENGDVTAMYSEYANQLQHKLTIVQGSTTKGTFDGSADTTITLDEGGSGGITNHEVIDTEASLPTATETSADFVQVSGELYFKKVEEITWEDPVQDGENLTITQAYLLNQSGSKLTIN